MTIGQRNKELGNRGERLAATWYKQRGYEVLATNWRCRSGELDLVLAKAGEIVFCEVKTRSSRRFGHPVEAVTYAKQRRIRGLAMQWLEATGTRRRGLRFDVATVEGLSVEVWPGVF